MGETVYGILVAADMTEPDPLEELAHVHQFINQIPIELRTVVSFHLPDDELAVRVDFHLIGSQLMATTKPEDNCQIFRTVRGRVANVLREDVEKLVAVFDSESDATLTS